MKKAEIIEVIPSKKIIVGEAKAPVTLMMFGDYESEASSRANEVVKEVLAAYPQEVNFIFRHFPLVKVHQKAHKAAEAALAAAQEGKFWEMHNELFAHRRNLGTISLKGHAREAGVQSKRFLDDLINSLYGAYIQDDLKEGIALGVNDIPALFINGERFKGEITFKEVSTAVKASLQNVDKKGKGTKKAA